MRWVVVGGNGMLGSDVVARLAGAAAGSTVRSLTKDDLDITDFDSCLNQVRGADVVVNCAAWTAVDDAESQEPAAFDVNALGPANLARACAQVGARLVHVSTDYVFDGRATSPYEVDDVVHPVSAYGRTKVAGEWAVAAASPDHLVVRTAWLYGANGASFPRTIARIAAERGSVQVVADQSGQPTWSADLADLLVRLVEARVPGGIYHGTASGEATWFDFAVEVVAASGSGAVVTPTTSEAFVRPAPRPTYSVLSHAGLTQVGIEPIADWKDRWTVAAAEIVGAS